MAGNAFNHLDIYNSESNVSHRNWDRKSSPLKRAQSFRIRNNNVNGSNIRINNHLQFNGNNNGTINIEELPIIKSVTQESFKNNGINTDYYCYGSNGINYICGDRYFQDIKSGGIMSHPDLNGDFNPPRQQEFGSESANSSFIVSGGSSMGDLANHSADSGIDKSGGSDQLGQSNTGSAAVYQLGQSNTGSAADQLGQSNTGSDSVYPWIYNSDFTLRRNHTRASFRGNYHHQPREEFQQMHNISPIDDPGPDNTGYLHYPPQNMDQSRNVHHRSKDIEPDGYIQHHSNAIEPNSYVHHHSKDNDPDLYVHHTQDTNSYVHHHSKDTDPDGYVHHPQGTDSHVHHPQGPDLHVHCLDEDNQIYMRQATLESDSSAEQHLPDPRGVSHLRPPSPIPPAQPHSSDRDDGYESPGTFSSDVTSSTSGHMYVLGSHDSNSREAGSNIDDTSPTQQPFALQQEEFDNMDNEPMLFNPDVVGPNNNVGGAMRADIDNTNPEMVVIQHDRQRSVVQEYPYYTDTNNQVSDEQSQVYYHQNNTIADNVDQNRAMLQRPETLPGLDCMYTDPQNQNASSSSNVNTSYEQSQGIINTAMMHAPENGDGYHNTRDMSMGQSPPGPNYSREGHVKTHLGYVDTKRIPSFKMMNSCLRRGLNTIDEEGQKSMCKENIIAKSKNTVNKHENEKNKPSSLEERIKILVISDDSTDTILYNTEKNKADRNQRVQSGYNSNQMQQASKHIDHIDNCNHQFQTNATDVEKMLFFRSSNSRGEDMTNNKTSQDDLGSHLYAKQERNQNSTDFRNRGNQFVRGVNSAASFSGHDLHHRRNIKPRGDNTNSFRHQRDNVQPKVNNNQQEGNNYHSNNDNYMGRSNKMADYSPNTPNHNNNYYISPPNYTHNNSQQAHHYRGTDTHKDSSSNQQLRYFNQANSTFVINNSTENSTFSTEYDQRADFVNSTTAEIATNNNQGNSHVQNNAAHIKKDSNKSNGYQSTAYFNTHMNHDTKYTENNITHLKDTEASCTDNNSMHTNHNNTCNNSVDSDQSTGNDARIEDSADKFTPGSVLGDNKHGDSDSISTPVIRVTHSDDINKTGDNRGHYHGNNHNTNTQVLVTNTNQTSNCAASGYDTRTKSNSDKTDSGYGIGNTHVKNKGNTHWDSRIDSNTYYGKGNNAKLNHNAVRNEIEQQHSNYNTHFDHDTGIDYGRNGGEEEGGTLDSIGSNHLSDNIDHISRIAHSSENEYRNASYVTPGGYYNKSTDDYSDVIDHTITYACTDARNVNIITHASSSVNDVSKHNAVYSANSSNIRGQDYKGNYNSPMVDLPVNSIKSNTDCMYNESSTQHHHSTGLNHVNTGDHRVHNRHGNNNTSGSTSGAKYLPDIEYNYSDVSSNYQKGTPCGDVNGSHLQSGNSSYLESVTGNGGQVSVINDKCHQDLTSSGVNNTAVDNGPPGVKMEENNYNTSRCLTGQGSEVRTDIMGQTRNVVAHAVITTDIERVNGNAFNEDDRKSFVEGGLVGSDSDNNGKLLVQPSVSLNSSNGGTYTMYSPLKIHKDESNASDVTEILREGSPPDVINNIVYSSTNSHNPANLQGREFSKSLPNILITSERRGSDSNSNQSSNNLSNRKVHFKLDLHGNTHHTTHYINKDTGSPIDVPGHNHSEIYSKYANRNSHANSNNFKAKSVTGSNVVTTLANIQPVRAKLVISQTQTLPVTSLMSSDVTLHHGDMLKHHGNSHCANNLNQDNDTCISTNSYKSARATSRPDRNVLSDSKTHYNIPTDMSSNSDNHSIPSNHSRHRTNPEGQGRNVYQREEYSQQTENRYDRSNEQNVDTGYGLADFTDNNYDVRHLGYDPEIQEQNSHYKSKTDVAFDIISHVYNRRLQGQKQLGNSTDNSRDMDQTHNKYSYNDTHSKQDQFHNMRNSSANREYPAHDSNNDIHSKEQFHHGRSVPIQSNTTQDSSGYQPTPPPYHHPPPPPPHTHTTTQPVPDPDPVTRMKTSMSDTNITEWLNLSSNTHRYNTLCHSSADNLLSGNSVAMATGDDEVLDSIAGSVTTTASTRERLSELRQAGGRRDGRRGGPVYASSSEIYQLLAAKRGNPLALRSPYYKHFAESSL